MYYYTYHTTQQPLEGGSVFLLFFGPFFYFFLFFLYFCYCATAPEGGSLQVEALLATHRNGRGGAVGGATAEGAWGGGPFLK